jgi:O-antigen/teichoic acid export membrane protein
MFARLQRTLRLEGTTLKHRVFRASLWSIAGLVFSAFLRFGSNLAMTRLLAPDMFGVMAIANTVLFGLALFSDLGLRQNIVQSARGGDPDYLNVAWTLQIFRGLVLFLIGLAASYILYLMQRAQVLPVGSVYSAPILPLVIAFLSSAAVVQGLESTKSYEARRHLAFSRVTLLDLLSQVVSVTGMIAWAYVDRSIWALVFGSWLAYAAKAILSHLFLPGTRNRLHWDPSTFREIIQFGKWIFLSSIIGFLVQSGDRLILGFFLDATTLGIYVVAFLLVSTVDLLLSKAITDVSLPAFSEIARDRPSQLRSSYYKLHAVAASSSYFCMGFLIVGGQSIVHVLYDSRYAEAGWMLQMLSIGLVTIPFRLATEYFIALGKPQLPSVVSATRLVALTLLPPMGFVWFGLPGALAGVVLSNLAWLPVQIYFQIRLRLFNVVNEFVPFGALMLGLVLGYCFQISVGSFASR